VLKRRDIQNLAVGDYKRNPEKRGRNQGGSFIAVRGEDQPTMKMVAFRGGEGPLLQKKNGIKKLFSAERERGPFIKGGGEKRLGEKKFGPQRKNHEGGRGIMPRLKKGGNAIRKRGKWGGEGREKTRGLTGDGNLIFWSGGGGSGGEQGGGGIWGSLPLRSQRKRDPRGGGGAL